MDDLVAPESRTGAVSATDALPSEIAAIVDGFEGQISFMVHDLGRHRTIAHHPDRKHPTASVIKLAVLAHALLAAHEGGLAMDEILEVRAEDQAPGSGVLSCLSPGLRLPLRDACMLMMAVSDNTATNLVLDRAGIGAVAERMRAIGCPQTRIFRKVFSSGPPVCRENARYGLGVTTPRETVRLLTLIATGRLGDATVSAEARRYLDAQQHRDGIPRLLPPACRYGGKTGAVDAVRNDVGIVTTPDGGEIVMAFYCSRMPQPLWTADNPGLLAIARLASACVRVLRPNLTPA